MKITILNVILIVLFCTISSCKNESGDNPCEGLLNEGPPRRIGIFFVDKGSGSNLILTDVIQTKNIKVTIGETGETFSNWRVISGPVDSPMNGFLELSFFNETVGDHTFEVKIDQLEEVIVSYNISKEKSEDPCKPYSYPITDVKILNHNWHLYNNEGRTSPTILVVKL